MSSGSSPANLREVINNTKSGNNLLQADSTNDNTLKVKKVNKHITEDVTENLDEEEYKPTQKTPSKYKTPSKVNTT